MWHSNLKKKNIYFSIYLPSTSKHMSHCFTSASKPAALKSFDCCLSHFRACSGIICDLPTSLREFLEPVVNRFTRQTLPTINKKHLFMNILCIGSFCTQKLHSRMPLFGSTLLKHGCHFDYWNQPLNMSMLVCYLDCHDSGLCCYLVIHIWNLYVHYICVTSIFDLLTEAPSWIQRSAFGKCLCCVLQSVVR
jgi:hypothetical protein